MKKLLPLIIMIVVLSTVGVKLLLAKQYCLLCCIKGHDVVVSAPSYFTDTFVAVLPNLF